MKIHINPRAVWSWFEFRGVPGPAIALDGFVRGGPALAMDTRHANFDHHDGVVREATMSTAQQVMFAIKGGLTETFDDSTTIYINDVDQDTTLAVWLLNYCAMFRGVGTNPIIGRLLALNDRLDITGGAYPMSLSDELTEMHNWVFEPYTNLKVMGRIGTATEAELRAVLESMLERITQLMMGQGQRKTSDVRHELVEAHPKFWAVKENGNEARYFLYSLGMKAFIAQTAPNRYSIGRRSRFVDFPLTRIYAALNKIDSAPGDWGGSDIIGGSPRENGTDLSFEKIIETIKRECT